MLEMIAKGWQFLRDLVTVVRPCRFSALVVAAGAVLLLSDQGREFMLRLPAEELSKAVWFDLCVFLWAFQSWYWARLMLDLAFGRDRGAGLPPPWSDRLHKLIVLVPRVLAAGSYLVALVACAFAGTWALALPLAIEGILFCVFLVWRTDLVSALGGGAPGWRRSLLSAREGDPKGLGALPFLSLFILGSSLAAAAGLTAWVCADAVGFGWTLGAAAVPFLGFSMLVPVGSFLVLAARHGGRTRTGDPGPSVPDTRGGYPVISLLLLLAFALSFFPALDNHGIRTLPAAEPASAPASLDQALDRWYAQAPRQSGDRANFIVVAAADGGLRAAYWTATTLGAIQDQAGAFNSQLFAITGVSGGSLGAAVFVTLVSGQVSFSDGRARCRQTETAVGRYECSGQAVLSQDFLAPTVAALLFPDLMQRFLPLGFPDRARALEQSWERAWRRAGFAADVWTDRGFRTLWPDGRYVPSLLLISTHVETGKRVIASSFAADAKVFRDAYDLYALISPGSDIRTSTAAHASARFPYVSPAGTLADGTHLADGAYFEDFGAQTAREVLKAGVARWGQKIRPVVILISNDPKLEEGDLPMADPKEPRRPGRETWAAEALSPVRALLHAREARGLLAASELRAAAEENGGKYFQFRLCREAGHPDPALGWVLSVESEDLMRRQLRSDACGNAGQLTSLLEALESR